MWAVVGTAGNGDGEGVIGLWLLYIAAALPTGYATLRGLRKPDPVSGSIPWALSATGFGPFMTIWPAIVSSAVTVSLPPVAIRMIAVLLILAFVVPALIIVGARNARASSVWEAFEFCVRIFDDPSWYWGDMVWVAGIVLVPIGVLVLILVKVLQRPNHALRAATDTAALGDAKKK